MDASNNARTSRPVRKRNAVLVRLMKSRGIATASDLARRLGLLGRRSEFIELVNTNAPARHATGEWRDLAKEIADFFDLAPGQIFDERQQWGKFDQVVPAKGPSDGEVSFSVGPDETNDRTSLTDDIEAVLSTLSPRERRVLCARFGIGCEPLTLRQIGEEFGVTHQRVWQIEGKTLRKLRLSATSIPLRRHLDLTPEIEVAQPPAAARIVPSRASRHAPPTEVPSLSESWSTPVPDLGGKGVVVREIVDGQVQLRVIPSRRLVEQADDTDRPVATLPRVPPGPLLPGPIAANVASRFAPPSAATMTEVAKVRHRRLFAGAKSAHQAIVARVVARVSGNRLKPVDRAMAPVPEPAPAPPVPRPSIARKPAYLRGRFQRLAWDGDRYVEVKPRRDFDAGTAMLRLSAASFRRIVVNARSLTGYHLRDLAAAAGLIGSLVGQHKGPYWMQVDPAMIEKFVRRLGINDIQAITDDDLAELLRDHSRYRSHVIEPPEDVPGMQP